MRRSGPDPDPAVLARSVVYDSDLTLTLPPEVSATSGLNALAHAVEALSAPDGSTVITAMAEQGVHDLAAALPVLVADSRDPGARAAALSQLGVSAADLPPIVEAVLANPYSNPRPVGRAGLEQLLTGAV